MAGETWTCPHCMQMYSLDQRMCPTCRVTQVRPRERIEKKDAAAAAPAPAPVPGGEIGIPLPIPEARFSLPFKEGAVWTMGHLVVTPAGFFLLSGSDGIKPEEVFAREPRGAQKLGERSLFIPLPMITRVTHDATAGFFIHADGKRIPLRLDIIGWRNLDMACEKLGITHV